MGREIRRVPEGFTFPLWETWPGCLGEAPFPPVVECEPCAGTGMPPTTRFFNNTFYVHQAGPDAWGEHLLEADLDALVKAGRDREARSWGRDAIDRWVMAKDRARRVGATEVESCEHCDGEGNHDRYRVEREAWWDQWEPLYPVGEWFQLWQTVSEGGPVSPAFATAEELALWMSTNKATAMGSVPYEDALMWIRGPGWAPTAMALGGVMSDGITGGV